MNNFAELRGAREFELNGLPYLLAAIRQLFSCHVTYLNAPLQRLRADGINVDANPLRGVYPLGDGSVILLGRVFERRTVVSVFSLKLQHAQFARLGYLLSALESALARTLSRSAIFRFEDRPDQFGEPLIELAIAKYFSKGHYDQRRFLFVLDLFRKLSTSTLEGRYFTTGLILTPSYSAYAGAGSGSRAGIVYSLAAAHHLRPEDGVEKRFWYLADGQTSFFMADHRLAVRDLFLLAAPRPQLDSFVDDYTLAHTVRGGDALLRVTSRGEYSVLGSKQVEFSYMEHGWRVRDFVSLVSILANSPDVSGVFVHSLLYFVFLLSRRRYSALIWVTRSTDWAGLVLSRNELTAASLSILDDTHTESIVRLMSSDGATVLGTDGRVLSYGSFVDISKAKVKGAKGTGETAATVLAAAGVAIKVSQDGAIKVFAAGHNVAVRV